MKKATILVLFAAIFCLPAVCAAAVPSGADQIALTQPTNYIVRTGDSLWTISRNIYHSGKYWSKIFYSNNLKKSATGYPIIMLDQQLTIPALTANEVMEATYMYSGSMFANASSTVSENFSTSSIENEATSSAESEVTSSVESEATSSLANPIATSGDHILYRIVKNCATGKPIGKYYSDLTEFKPDEWILGYLQMVDLDKTGYENYTCENRYQEQCIDDGSFDSYYEEWCSPGTESDQSATENIDSNISSPTPKSSATEPKLSAAESLSGQVASLISNGAELLTKITTSNIDDTKGLILFRIIRNCATGAGIIDDDYPVLTTFGPGRWEIHTLQEVFLDSADYYNYECHSRFQEQCINDGSFDSYYDELCVRQ
jgi:hypothetical protein